MPGTAEIAGEPLRSGMGMEFPGPVRGDGLGNHRMHDILLACGTTLFGAVIDIVLEGYESLAASRIWKISSTGALIRRCGDRPALIIGHPAQPLPFVSSKAVSARE